MKRSKKVVIPRLIKAPNFSLKIISAAVASVVATGCSTKEEVFIYKSVEECNASGKFTLAKCETAYSKALTEAQRTAPRYRNASDCEHEFGKENCRPHQFNGQNYFLPAMAGFMVSQALMNNNYNSGYYSNPLFYHYDNGYSTHRRPTWRTADGVNIGGSSRTTANVSKADLKPKPKVTKTMSRGGFGSKVAAKSSWGGGSSSRSSWGG